MIVTIVLLSILLIVSCYINWNLLSKLEKLQDFSDNLARWVDGLNQQLDKIMTQIDVIDEKGMFKSDDYVGEIYKDISNLIKNLNNIIIKEGDDESNNGSR